MAAPIWKGAIAFGLVHIPVRLHTAVRANELSFRMLRRGDLCPLKYERVCKADEKEVAWKDVVKGYEVEKGKFVVLEDDDFAKATARVGRTMEIQDFVREGDVDPRYFDKPYYLVAEKGGEKAYALLREAMLETGTLGIGTIAIRQRESLAALKVVGEALVLEMMRYADEIVDAGEYRFPGDDVELKPQERKMATQLIANLTAAFEPEKYRDRYRETLVEIIHAKARGKQLRVAAPAEPEATGVIDLMERLEASLRGSGTAAPKKRAAARSKARSGGAAKKKAGGSRRKSA